LGQKKKIEEWFTSEEKVNSILANLNLEEFEILRDKLLETKKKETEKMYTLYDFVE
jgi:hypothetical protein